jgi:hypothetical protein
MPTENFPRGGADTRIVEIGGEINFGVKNNTKKYIIDQLSIIFEF